MSSEKPSEALKDLAARLARARQGQDSGPFVRRLKGEDRPASGLGTALRIGVELVSALAVGTAIGWGLDYWLGTAPWLMLVFIVLGGAAGILNVYKLASGFSGAVGYRPTPDGGDDEQGPDKGPGR